MPAKTARPKTGPTCRKVTVLPTIRPTPPPPPKATPVDRPGVLYSSGAACPANDEIACPEKIRATKGEKGYCDRCLSRRGDKATTDLEGRRLDPGAAHADDVNPRPGTGARNDPETRWR